MIAWITDNLVTIVIMLLVAAAFAGAVTSMINSKGKCCGCSGCDKDSTAEKSKHTGCH